MFGVDLDVSVVGMILLNWYDVSKTVLWDVDMSLVITFDVSVVLSNLDMSLVIAFDVNAVLWNVEKFLVVAFDVNVILWNV